MIRTQLEALAVDTRRQIYGLLVERPRSVQDLADELPVSRPAVSQHLKVLVEARLARSSNVGTRRVYSPDPAGAAALRAWADRLWSEAVGTFADFADFADVARGVDGPQRTGTTSIAGTTHKETAMLDQRIDLEPVVKSRRLGVPPEAAFELFTARMTSWWPLASHSVGAERATSVRMEPQVGGRIVETTEDGIEHEWGRVTAWEPGRRVEFSWHPGLPAAQATIVDVRFREIADGTEMLLVHSGWEARGADGPAVRANYESGWDVVLGEFKARGWGAVVEELREKGWGDVASAYADAGWAKVLKRDG